MESMIFSFLAVGRRSTLVVFARFASGGKQYAPDLVKRVSLARLLWFGIHEARQVMLSNIPPEEMRLIFKKVLPRIKRRHPMRPLLERALERQADVTLLDISSLRLLVTKSKQPKEIQKLPSLEVLRTLEAPVNDLNNIRNNLFHRSGDNPMTDHEFDCAFRKARDACVDIAGEEKTFKEAEKILRDQRLLERLNRGDLS